MKEEEILYGKPSIRFYTLGCKLNFTETSSLRRELLQNHFQEAREGEKEQISIINTCSVTDVADKKANQLIRRISRENGESIIVVTGCYAQLKPEAIEKFPNVHLIIGNGKKQEIPSLVEKIVQLSNAERVQVGKREEMNDFMPSSSSDDRTRYFLKIQDGCDYFCTYCTIPFARGKSRNHDIQSTCEEALKVKDKGAKEIILTGVNIGDFGASTGETFFELIKALEHTLQDVRIRISSIEPNLLTDEIIDFVASSKCFMPHFHIPLQCGNDEVLRLMHRRYDTSLFSSRIERIKTLLPNAFIGVDVIVGMRGEKEEYFENSKHFLENLPISQLHVFPYSERPHTQALKIFPIVPEEEKHKRCTKLIHLSKEKLKQFYLSQKGTEQEVLFEQPKNEGKMQGFTPNYLHVEIHYREEWVNRVVKIHLTDFDEERMMYLSK
ncbi:MAG TPA: tRNA (N(6)-L-threonylcarbamoyladenosine(37)-C(2))-methylthiotransferase MtaB [Porphyromonadaceae bacterium]|nr:tRNA (N(6)-L-threonylcarbamoyladenosine(37)-C(2))-methylthiotransferase MtaB [Porphyromonadaceae bacterium]